MQPQMNSRRGRRSINAEPRQRRMKIARYARRKPRQRLAPKCREKFEKTIESRQGRLKIYNPELMAYHTFASILVHYVFSTKNREALITEEMQPRLWAYMGGIARTNNMKALAIGGMPDHVHLLLSLHPSLAVDKAIQLIKSGSSGWMHDQGQHDFGWQTGYGAFTIGMSQVNATLRYIANQKKHHARESFAEEWKIFLDRHGLQEYRE